MKHLFVLALVLISIPVFSQVQTKKVGNETILYGVNFPYDSTFYKLVELKASNGKISYAPMVYINEALDYQYPDMTQGRASYSLNPKIFFGTKKEAQNFLSLYNDKRKMERVQGRGWNKNNPTPYGNY